MQNSFGFGSTSSTSFSTQYGNQAATWQFTGTGFSSYQGGLPGAGTITGITYKSGGVTLTTLSNLNLPITTFYALVGYPNTWDILTTHIFAGNDTINGTAQNDYLSGYGGVNTISGGGGDDTLLSSNGLGQFDGGAGVDQLTISLAQISSGLTIDAAAAASAPGATLANGTVLKNLEVLAVTTGSGNDTFVFNGPAILGPINQSNLRGSFDGGAGNDLFVGDFSSATVALSINAYGSNLIGFEQGSGGFGLLNVEAVQIAGGAQNDVMFGMSGNDVLFGGGSNDTIDGGAGNDIINGGDDNDNMIWSGGVDQIDGGAGTDAISLDFRSTSAAVNIVASQFVQPGGVTLTNGTTLQNIETLGDVFLGSGDDTLTIDIVPLELFGPTDYSGGGGVDTLVIDYSTAAMSFGLFSYPDYSQLGHLFFRNFEHFVIFGSNHSAGDQFGGGDFSDFLYGNAGDDSLNGAGGDDVLDGGAGADRMYGRSGNDIYYVDDAGDQFIEEGGVDEIRTTLSYTLAAEFENLTLLGSALNGTGNNAANIIIGNAQNNTLIGLDGADVLAGGGGADVLSGGDGNDTADYATSSAEVHVNLTTSVATGGDATGDTISSFENAIGSAFADTLVGTSGVNALTAGAGNDVLTGAGDNDILSGGLGVDTSIYASSSSGASWHRNPDGSWTVTAGADGTDTVTGVEFLDFTDRDVFLDRAYSTFSGDGTSDIFMQNANGSMSLRFVNGSGVTGNQALATALDGTWDLKGVGDFDGDSKDDVLIWHDSGFLAGWFMNGATIANAAGFGGVTKADWDIDGIGDINGDGKDDIIIWHDSGFVGAWLMNGAQATGLGLAALDKAVWDIEGLADFNGDGTDDILWRNSSGDIGLWFMDDGHATGVGLGNVGHDWAIEGLGDFNGDGKDDILLRHDSGWTGMWLMDGSNATAVGIGTIGHDFAVAAVGDYNGDGRDDILWWHDNGNLAAWFMNGAAATSASYGTLSHDWIINPS